MTVQPSIARVDHRANNFDFVRLVAATLVLFSHCFAVTGMGGAEPLVRLTSGQYHTFGGLAVRVFFVISGHLVTQSWLRQSRAIYFVSARVLRIFPALALALVYGVLIGAAVTTIPWREFWSSPETLDYVWSNLLLDTRFFLPGVFEANLYPRAVNGAIWSLHFEVYAYGIVLVLGVLGMFSRRWLGALGWLVAAVLIVAWPQAWGMIVANDWPVINLCACFVAAALVALFPETERWLGWIAVGTVVALLAIGIRPGATDIAVDALLIAGTLWFARRRIPGIATIGRFGDFSYGVFLFAFPTQQLIAWLTHTQSPYLMLALALPATLALAALSWHLVEKPCLRVKRHLDRFGKRTPAIVVGG